MTSLRKSCYKLAFGAMILCLGVTFVAATISASNAQSIQGQTGASDPTSATARRVADGFSWFTDFETRFSSWKGTRGTNTLDPTPGSGSQIYTPATVGLDFQQPEVYRLQTRVKGGYVRSIQRAAGQEASIDGLVDTQVTTTITYLGAESYRTFAGVALNLPTGTSYLPGNQRLTRMDPDLVDVGAYGAGFNINPTTGVIFALTETTAVSVSSGYAWQGPFDRETLDQESVRGCVLILCGAAVPQPAFDAKRRIDPGDIFTANANTSSIFDTFSLKTSFAYLSETELKQDGIYVGRKGASYVVNSVALFKLADPLSLILNGSWKYTEKDKIIGPGGELVDEPKNRNSNVFIGSIEPVYAVSQRVVVGANYSVLWRRENYYDFTEDQFVPAKIKQSVGGSLSYAVSPQASLSIRGSRFWVKEDDGPYLVTLIESPGRPFQRVLMRDYQPSANHYTGWTAVVAGKIAF